MVAHGVRHPRCVRFTVIAMLGSSSPPDFVVIGEFAVLGAADLVVRGGGPIAAHVTTAWSDYSVTC